jgi:hypothetical protein
MRSNRFELVHTHFVTRYTLCFGYTDDLTYVGGMPVTCAATDWNLFIHSLFLMTLCFGYTDDLTYVGGMLVTLQSLLERIEQMLEDRRLVRTLLRPSCVTCVGCEESWVSITLLITVKRKSEECKLSKYNCCRACCNNIQAKGVCL